MKRLLFFVLLCVPGMAMAQEAPAEQCSGLIAMPQAQKMAQDWIAAWNSHKADNVMALYADDIEMRSPYILTSPRLSDPSGMLKGKVKTRQYWFGDGDGNQTRMFELLGVFAGIRSVTIYYRSGAVEVTEVEDYNADCKVVRSDALYGPLPAPAPK